MSCQTAIISKMPGPITQIFGGQDKLVETAGLLTWDNKFVGINYIDRIRPEDLGEHQVVVGSDPYNRIFVAFKVTEYLPDKDPQENVICLFQRYGDSPHTWVGGTTALGRLNPQGYFLDGNPSKIIDNCAEKQLNLYQRVVKNNFKCYSGFDT